MAEDTCTTRTRWKAKGKLVILVVGQVPPPINGQSVMIAQFLDGDYSELELVHVPLRFSRGTDEVGKFGFRKIGVLFQTLVAIIQARLVSGATVLYYPPAGPHLVPILRDLFLLLSLRWLFQDTVFHFHAASLCSIYPRLSMPLRWLFLRAYGYPSLAIYTTNATAESGSLLHPAAVAIVPCGVPDRVVAPNSADEHQIPNILFAGILCEGKGVRVLLEACALLKAAGELFNLVCIGEFESLHFELEVQSFLYQNNLQDCVTFPGILRGCEKAYAFASASIFCFPSHYPSESFGVVLIEAMSYELPIIATQWQGIPEVTGSGGAVLVPVKDVSALAEALRLLLNAPDFRRRMGSFNRSRYLSLYTAEIYRTNMAAALSSLHTLPMKIDARVRR